MQVCKVRIAEEDDIDFLAGCGHSENDIEILESIGRKREFFRKRWKVGLVSLIGLVEGNRAGFLNMFPIEISPWGPFGEDLYVIPCLFVIWDHQRRELGKAMMSAAIEMASKTSRKGIVAFAFSEPDWFLPEGFFKRFGFAEISSNGDEKLLLLKFSNDVKTPVQFVSRYVYHKVPGKVVVDLFYNTFCSTSDIEAQRVKEVAAEFGESVVLRSHEIDDEGARERFSLPRGIFVNGREIFWGYEAPREGIREAILRELNQL